MVRIAVLGSTRGSTFEGLLQCFSGQHNPIKLVLSNKPTAGILSKAQKSHIEYIVVQFQKGESREAFDRRVSAELEHHQIDLVLMIGYMRIVSKWFTDKWQGKLLNVHPSLLPKHKGLMDLAVHQAVLDAHEQESGCSVHYVTEEVDGGDVLVQLKCDVEASDTAESLKAKVQALEARALYRAVLTYFE